MNKTEMSFGWDKLVADGPYGALAVDPPWQYQTWSDKGQGKSASQHYPVMTLGDIKNLPVQDLALQDCVLFLWAIDSMLPQALDVIDAWGFTYKTVAFTWAKQGKVSPWHFGMGHWTRGNPEMCLLATRGHPKRLGKGVRQLLVTPRGAHSAKPEEAQDRIEQLMGYVPRCELFARRPRAGWACWGAECEYSDKPNIVLSRIKDTGCPLPQAHLETQNPVII